MSNLSESAAMVLVLLMVGVAVIVLGCAALADMWCDDACFPRDSMLVDDACYCHTGRDTWTRRALP